MKLNFLALSTFMLLPCFATAANKTVTVKQVSESITLSDDVDYVITDKTPFGDDGSVNIENTDNAVLIIQNMKPSLVLSNNILNKVFINGAQAVDGTNCQVRLYTQGTIILPYDKSIKPLTVYSETNCEGESCSDFGLENNGGYMNTLSAKKLNNRIRSFVLKRGYMVTFAIGQGGWGYSRCFIAQDEDLVINTLPDILDQRISSYRVFEWVYAQKKGLASDANAERNAMLSTCWSYDWGQGNTSLLPDVEWVPNHIYEDWPTSATIGGRTGTCHTKNNNEPANSSDDHPQSVETVLDNWQNMMRTGLRLCSPATHDGGWAWHNEFMNEIDKRGWRCDVVDFHGYWNSGTWGNLDGYIDSYAHGRPVWFSEWLWGSSWGKQGIFADGVAPDGVGSFSTRNQQACYDGTKPILDRLNSNERVERYAYWNGENVASRLIHDGQLSILGKYYASMNTPIAYRKSREFTPTEPTLTSIDNLECSYNRKTNVVSFTWSETYGDLITSIILQRKSPGSSTWQDIDTYASKDQNSKAGVEMRATDNLAGAEPGEYEYRIKDVTYKKKNLFSNSVSVSISSQQMAADFIFGSANVPTAFDVTSTTTINNTAVYADLEGLDVVPSGFLGLPSYKNKQVGVTSFLNSIGKSQIKFGAMVWGDGFTGSYTNTETMDYVVIPEGTYHYNGLQVVVGKKASVGNTDVDVTFDSPFPEGETPVVICQPYMTSLKYGTVPRVSEVTNTGFKLRHVGQSTQTSVTKKSIYYIAVSKGQAVIDDGYLLSVGVSEKPAGGRTTSTTILFDSYNSNGESEVLLLSSPIILCGPQTDRLPEVATTFRINTASTVDAVSEGGISYKATRGLSIMRQMDASAGYTGTNTADANGDTMGWICISRLVDDGEVGVGSITAETTNGTRAIYTLDGKRMPNGLLTPGVYIINDNGIRRKVAVK